MGSPYQKPAANHPVTILLVEDDPIIRDSGRELLEAMGYRVATAADGDIALEVFAGLGNVDLVILDYYLPGQNGLMVLQKLRALDPGVQVLMASGYFSRQDTVKLQESGAAAFIAKPYRVSGLESLILRVLKAERGL